MMIIPSQVITRIVGFTKYHPKSLPEIRKAYVNMKIFQNLKYIHLTLPQYRQILKEIPTSTYGKLEQISVP